MVLECTNHNLKVTLDSELLLEIKGLMKHSFTSQTWPRYQPQSPDSPQHGQPADYVQRAQTCSGCPPLPTLGSAFQPPAKSDTSHSRHHPPFTVKNQYLFRTPIHTSPSHFSLNYCVFRLKNSNTTYIWSSLLFFSEFFNSHYPFEDGGIRILHKIQACNGFRCHDDILSSSSSNSFFFPI